MEESDTRKRVQEISPAPASKRTKGEEPTVSTRQGVPLRVPEVECEMEAERATDADNSSRVGGKNKRPPTSRDASSTPPVQEEEEAPLLKKKVCVRDDVLFIFYFLAGWGGGQCSYKTRGMHGLCERDKDGGCLIGIGMEAAL